jgi:EmrB/QacA subfamily drug resistance transporter
MTSTAAVAPRPFAVLATLLSATFMQLVDVSIVNVAIPSIQRDLGASYADIQLVVAVYQLAFACVLITAARLGDIHGRRRLFLIGMSGFTAASILCGAATSPEMLVVARLLQGLMSGCMFPQVLSVIQVSFAPEERGKAFGLYGATIGVAAISGPLLGGALIAVDPFGLDWRSVFYVNVPIGLAGLFAAVRNLPESRAPHAHALDLPGAALVTVGLLFLILPLTEGRERGWPGWMLAMLVASAPVLAWFWILQARKTARDASPLIHTSLFRDRHFALGVILQALLLSGIPAFFFITTLYFQIGFGFTPLHAGLSTLPFAAGSTICSLVSDRLVRRFGGRILEIGALALVAAMLGLRATVSLVGDDMNTWHLVPTMLIAGIGLGAAATPLNAFILAGVMPRDVGAASGILSTGQRIGGAIGVAVVGGIYGSILPVAPPIGESVRRAGHATALADTLLVPTGLFALALILLFVIQRMPPRQVE